MSESKLTYFWRDDTLVDVGLSCSVSEESLSKTDRAIWDTYQQNKAVKAENVKLKEVLSELYSMYKTVCIDRKRTVKQIRRIHRIVREALKENP